MKLPECLKVFYSMLQSQPFFKLLSMLVEFIGGPPGMPAFTQIVLHKFWEVCITVTRSSCLCIPDSMIQIYCGIWISMETSFALLLVFIYVYMYIIFVVISQVILLTWEILHIILLWNALDNLHFHKFSPILLPWKVLDWFLPHSHTATGVLSFSVDPTWHVFHLPWKDWSSMRFIVIRVCWAISRASS